MIVIDMLVSSYRMRPTAGKIVAKSSQDSWQELGSFSQPCHAEGRARTACISETDPDLDLKVLDNATGLPDRSAGSGS